MAETTVDFISPVQITIDDSQVSIAAGGETVVDLTAGADGALLAANNLSDLVTVATARTNLGATATGVSLFTAVNAAAAATAVGATVTGAAVLTAASAAAAATAIGATVTGSALLTAATAGDAQTALGLAPSDFGAIDLNCDSDGTLGVIKFQALTAGTVNTVRGTLYGTGPSDQAIAIDMTIGGVAVTGGGVTFNAGVNDGATANSTATAANTFVAGDVIAVGVTTTNTASLRGTFQIVYTRT